MVTAPHSTGDIRPVTTVSGDPLDVLFSTTKASETTPRTDRESPPMETDSSVRDKAPPDTEKEPPSLADTTARTDSVPESTLRVEEGTEDGEVKPKLTTSLSGSTGRQRTLPSWLSGLASEGSREPPAARKRKAPKASVSKRKVEEDEEIAPPPTKVSVCIGLLACAALNTYPIHTLLHNLQCFTVEASK